MTATRILSMMMKDRWAGTGEPCFLAQVRRVGITALVSRKASSRAAKAAVATGRAHRRLMGSAIADGYYVNARGMRGVDERYDSAPWDFKIWKPEVNGMKVFAMVMVSRCRHP